MAKDVAARLQTGEEFAAALRACAVAAPAAGAPPAAGTPPATSTPPPAARSVDISL
jgi:hypothetical protein